ncbi:MAG: DegT/DnrJ/EryC1/StrS family aminotransferase [Gemmatimonadaceae bacterium]|nr:DegT/DnrJ/EryC1/StrS family aminotransferase [Gemmatimonadaceae bacterium]
MTTSAAEPIPQTDPRASYVAHREEIDAAIGRVLRNGRYINGPEVEAFEAEFGEYHGGARAVAVASGTDALHLALRACGVGPGDRVVTVSHTAVATVAAIELAGATPVLVDIDPRSYTLDVRQLEAHLTGAESRSIKAIIPVHLYGHPANMPAITTLAQERGWRVIEDCAQSHGAALHGRLAGTWGDIAAFSFYPTKNLGAIGDGGAVLTANAELADRVRLLREYGWRQRYVSDVPGTNSRLDELQAAILRVKLRYLTMDNARRERIAARYHAGLAGSALSLPLVAEDTRHAFHQFVVRTSRRDAVRESLAARGVSTLVHYPVPVHGQPAYRGRIECAGSMAETESAASEVLSLPMFPELADAQLDRAIAVLHEVATEAPGR